jgi:hypothetical protein
MDNVQKHHICINVPSSQTFRSYLVNTLLIIKHTDWRDLKFTQSYKNSITDN